MDDPEWDVEHWPDGMFGEECEVAERHMYDCICEDCLQNHPERDVLYGNADYFAWQEG